VRALMILAVGTACLAGCATQPRGESAGKAPAVAADPAPAAPNWTTIATPGDRARLAALGDSWARARAAVPRRLAGRIAAEGALLDPAAALDLPALSPGSYRCRLVRLGGRAGYASFAPDFCYVDGDGAGLSFTKQTGRARSSIFTNWSPCRLRRPRRHAEFRILPLAGEDRKHQPFGGLAKFAANRSRPDANESITLANSGGSAAASLLGGSGVSPANGPLAAADAPGASGEASAEDSGGLGGFGGSGGAGGGVAPRISFAVIAVAAIISPAAITWRPAGVPICRVSAAAIPANGAALPCLPALADQRASKPSPFVAPVSASRSRASRSRRSFFLPISVSSTVLH